MLLDFLLFEICSSNLGYEKAKDKDINSNLFNLYSKKFFTDLIKAEKKAPEEIKNQYETETAIYTTSIPTESIKTVMYICYAAGILFFSFTVSLFIYAIYKCKQHNYQEI